MQTDSHSSWKFHVIAVNTSAALLAKTVYYPVSGDDNAIKVIYNRKKKLWVKDKSVKLQVLQVTPLRIDFWSCNKVFNTNTIEKVSSHRTSSTPTTDHHNHTSCTAALKHWTSGHRTGQGCGSTSATRVRWRSAGRSSSPPNTDRTKWAWSGSGSLSRCGCTMSCRSSLILRWVSYFIDSFRCRR